MAELNRLLQRQIKRVFGAVGEIPPEWGGFVEAINDAYNSFEEDHSLLERSVELSSNELFQANSEMRALFEAMPDLFIRLNQENQVVDCKAGSESGIQIRPEQAIGKPFDSLPIVDSANILIQAVESTHQETSQQSIEYEVRYEQKLYYFEARLIPLPDNNVIIIIRDITARKQAEDDLLLIEKRLRRQNQVLVELTKNKSIEEGELHNIAQELTKATAWAVDIERSSIWLFDEHKTKIDCIDLYQAGIQQHSAGIGLYAKDFPTYFKTLKSDRVIDANDAQTDPRTCEFTGTYLAPLDIRSMLDAPILLDGETVGVLCLEHTGSIKQWALEEVHFAASIADLFSRTLEVRARKEAQQALSESENKFRILAETTNSAIFVFQDKFLYVNPAMEQLTGYKAAELLKLNILDIVEHKYRDEILELIQLRNQRAADPMRFEIKIINKEGDPLWLLLTSGLIDFNGKPANIATAFDITERKLAEEQLRHQAFHDKLTGLPNRALFLDRLNHVFNLAKYRDGPIFAVLFIDLDRFKIINDSLGHDTGDVLLRQVTTQLKHVVRDTDTIARLGGDEFTILLEAVHGVNHTIQVAERIREILAHPLHINGRELYITASIGIALYDPSYENPEFMLRDADIAMYRAKANGKAGHEVFNSAMHAKALDLMQLETDLRNAIDNEQLQLHYQPIICLESGQLLGFESLLRWNHHERDFVSPIDFIPIAEETGLIIDIGYWVIKSACQQLHAWQTRYKNKKSIYVSVNVSAKQIAKEDFVTSVTQIIDEVGVDPSGLKIELTESMLLDNPERIIKLLDQLRTLGIEIYVDDFGTGYSSLSYLNRYPIDVLKIDRTFVNMIGDAGENTELVDAIVSLAHSLHMSVIAEGIENKRQMNYLLSIGCAFAQGFYFSKPVSVEHAEKLLEQDCLAPLQEGCG